MPQEACKDTGSRALLALAAAIMPWRASDLTKQRRKMEKVYVTHFGKPESGQNGNKKASCSAQ